MLQQSSHKSCIKSRLKIYTFGKVFEQDSLFNYLFFGNYEYLQLNLNTKITWQNNIKHL